ncbi:uncharacterized protein LOC129190000 [Dunckerocampus dactyliophorus]|uniref:uncharacterized protein LOC129190000 n=1 Tax=Dunckerocampus dactyliophorus TaxID=161453 RepID=UPI002404B308|nr:uncharacterized protein LOC129190000 [Dunckerocampus dactyliophorus]
MAGPTALVLLSTLALVEAYVLQPMSFAMVEVGVNVTLECPHFDHMRDIFYWYKMKFGSTIQTIAEGYFGEISLQSPFKYGRFASVSTGGMYILNITNVRKDDEAMYTCQAGTSYNMRFIGGTHLVVKDPKHKSFRVKQIPQSKSVEEGQSVTVQCSIFTESKEHLRQCPDQQSVYWFKSGSGESHPHIVYSDRDDEEDKRRCVYQLSLTIHNSSDAGTYYCAVATCGQILFGQGTHVETRQDVKRAAILLGALLASAAIVVTVVVG